MPAFQDEFWAQILIKSPEITVISIGDSYSRQLLKPMRVYTRSSPKPVAVRKIGGPTVTGS